MSYTDELYKEINHILNTDTPQKNLYQYIETLYEKALYESKKTGQSLESITYEILEGIESSHILFSDDLEVVLHHCSLLMMQTLHSAALRSLKAKNQKIQQAKSQLLETLETEKSYLWEILHTFKNYAEENRHTHWKKSLHQTELAIINHITVLSKKVESYTQTENQGIL